MLLRTAHELTVENDGIAETIALARGILRADVIREICVHLEPYQAGEKPITGETRYTLTCIDLSGTTQTKTATVRILPTFQEI